MMHPLAMAGPRFGQVVADLNQIKKAYGPQGEAMATKVSELIDHANHTSTVRDLEQEGVDIRLSALEPGFKPQNIPARNPSTGRPITKDGQPVMDRVIPVAVEPESLKQDSLSWKKPSTEYIEPYPAQIALRPMENPYDESKPALVASISTPPSTYGPFMRAGIVERVHPNRVLYQGDPDKLEPTAIHHAFSHLVGKIIAGAKAGMRHYSR